MTNDAPAKHARRTTALAGSVLVIAIVAVYARTFSAPFEFDDFVSIVRNNTIRHLWPLADVFAPPHELGSTVGGRPLLNLSFALNHAVSDYAVWSYHVLNLVIHAGCALLLFGIVRRTRIGVRRESERLGVDANIGVPALAARRTSLRWPEPTFFALAVAALWALHPLNTEAVTYISQRAESLASFFYLAVVYGFVRATQNSEVPRDSSGLPAPTASREPTAPVASVRARTSWLIVSIGACFLGALSKEIVATAPVVILLFDRTFVAGTFRAAWHARRGYYVALAASWLVVAALIASTANRGGTAGFGTGVSAWSYLLTQAHAITHYLALAAWPHRLVFDYGTGLAHGLAEVWPYASAVVVLLVVSVLTFFRRNRTHPVAHVAGFLGLAFFFLLAPSSSFVPIGSQTMAEHRMYLPLAAAIALVVTGSTRCLGRWAIGLTLLLAIAGGALTARRNETYRSAFALWSDTVARAPANPRAHNNLGDILVTRRQYSDAMFEYETAIRLQPDYADAQSNLGHALVRLGRAVEAVPHEEIAAKLKPDSADVFINYGLALSHVDRVPEAIAAFKRALTLDPSAIDARYDLANAYYQARDFSTAAATYRDVLSQQPDRHDARFNLAFTLLQLDQPQDALAQFEVLLQQNPNDADAHAEVGNILAYLGRTTEAVAHFETALRLKPDFPAVRQQYDQLRRGGGR